MTLILDTRTPIFVLVAQFNPAIFEPAWIARHLFDKKEGEDMQIMEMLAQSANHLVQFSFFDGVALNVTPDRTELLVIDGEPQTLEKLEAILLKMLSVLPHSPVSAIGCNFTYVDDTPTEKLIDLFETREALEGEGKLNLRQSGVQLQLGGTEVLNFNRTLTEQGIRFTFKYHQQENDVDKYKEFIPGIAARAMSHSKKIQKSYYGYDDFNVVGFVEGAQKGEDGDVGESAN